MRNTNNLRTFLWLTVTLFTLLFSGCRNVSLSGKTDSFDPIYPQPDGNGNSGFLSPFDMDTTIDVDWVFDLNAAMSNATPYFGKDFITVTTKYGRLYAIDRKTGKQWGVKNVDGAIDRAFFAEPEMVYFGTTDKDFGTLSSVNIKSGSEHWEIETGSIESELLVNGKSVVFGTYSGQILSVNKFTGTVNWTYNLPKTNRILSNFLSIGNNIAAIDDKGILYMLDSQSGALNTKLKVAGNFDGKVYHVEDNLYLSDRDGNFIAVNLSDFSVRWNLLNPYGKINGGFTFENDRFFAVTMKGSLISVLLADGKVNLLADLKEGSSATPVVTPNQFIVSLNNSKVLVLDRKTCSVLKSYDFDGRVKSPVFLLSPTEAFVYAEDKLFVRLVKKEVIP